MCEICVWGMCDVFVYDVFMWCECNVCSVCDVYVCCAMCMYIMCIWYVFVIYNLICLCVCNMWMYCVMCLCEMYVCERDVCNVCVCVLCCVCMCVWVGMHACHDVHARITEANHTYSFLWILEIELKSSGLCASACTHCTISPACHWHFNWLQLQFLVLLFLCLQEVGLCFHVWCVCIQAHACMCTFSCIFISMGKLKGNLRYYSLSGFLYFGFFLSMLIFLFIILIEKIIQYILIILSPLQTPPHSPYPILSIFRKQSNCLVL